MASRQRSFELFLRAAQPVSARNVFQPVMTLNDATETIGLGCELRYEAGLAPEFGHLYS